MRNFKPSDDGHVDKFDIILENPTIEECSLYKTVLTSKLNSIIHALSVSAAQSKAAYIMLEPSKGNLFDRIVTDSLPQNGIAIGVTNKKYLENISGNGFFSVLKQGA